jgi:signal transduction histidine kinase
MGFTRYVKERWLLYVFLAAGFLFSFVVYKLDRNFNITPSNASYIVLGLAILLVSFICTDYAILNARIKRFREYCKYEASPEVPDDFFYPLDREYLDCVNEISSEYERFRAEIRTRASEDMDFVTKWLHDMKVPISALKLILENGSEALPRDMYERMDIEIARIQQSTQDLFYNLKSESFSDDYRITRVGTKKLVADVLKEYASFFSYKKIQISISGEDCNVLTDEKWSSYIISQIVSNAVKYTPMEGSIDISTFRSDGRVYISIKNSGEGIHPRDIGQIFNKGYTSSENRSGMKATGYGMYLSKKIAGLLGHELSVESEYGKYACFRLGF